jgi:glycosyltransferase 2 family protein
MYDQEMKAKKQIAGVLLLLLLVVFTFFFYLRGYSYGELGNALRNANYAYLLLGLGMMFLFICCEAVNIRMIMKVLGYEITIGRCMQYSSIGFYFSSITPSASGGQPAQIYYMKKDEIPVATSSITIFFLVFVYQIAMMLLGIIMSFLRYSMAVNFIAKLKYLFLFGVIVNTGVIIVLFLLMFSKKLVPLLVKAVLKIAGKIRFLRKLVNNEEKLSRSLEAYHEKALLIKDHPVLFFKVLFVTIIQMIALSLIPLLVYLSLGYHTNHMADFITCQSLLTISVSAVPLPGAEGISQGGFLQVFAMFFNRKTLVSAMLINRVISFYLPLVFSFGVYIITHLRIARQIDRGDDFDGK